MIWQSVIEDPMLKEAYLLRAIKLELLQGNVKGLEDDSKSKVYREIQSGKTNWLYTKN